MIDDVDYVLVDELLCDCDGCVWVGLVVGCDEFVDDWFVVDGWMFCVCVVDCELCVVL